MYKLLQDTMALIGSVAEDGRPLLVGIDGRSGAGKSTFAAALAEAISGKIVGGDAFFAGGVKLRRYTPEQRAEACIDRPKLRSVLETLQASRAATYREFDWHAFDGIPIAFLLGPNGQKGNAQDVAAWAVCRLSAHESSEMGGRPSANDPIPAGRRDFSLV